MHGPSTSNPANGVATSAAAPATDTDPFGVSDGEPADTDQQRVATIDGDLWCNRCGYNLRSQRDDAACPECGQGVAETLRRLVVDPRKPGDARAFASGLRLCAISLTITALALPGTGLLGEASWLLLVSAVAVEYITWAVGVRRIVACTAKAANPALRSRQQLASFTAVATALAAGFTALTLLSLFGAPSSSSEALAGIFIFGAIALTQVFRVISAAAALTLVGPALRGLSLRKHATALAAAGWTTCAAAGSLGLSHLGVIPMLFWEFGAWEGPRYSPVVQLVFGLIAWWVGLSILAVHVAAAWAAVTVWVTRHAAAKFAGPTRLPHRYRADGS